MTDSYVFDKDSVLRLRRAVRRVESLPLDATAPRRALPIGSGGTEIDILATDPLSPSGQDIWINSTEDCLKYAKSETVEEVTTVEKYRLGVAKVATASGIVDGQIGELIFIKGEA